MTDNLLFYHFCTSVPVNKCRKHGGEPFERHQVHIGFQVHQGK